MILRNSALRHGRRAVSSPVGRSRLPIPSRALSTDGRQPPLPTAYVDPTAPLPPPTQDAAAPGAAIPGQDPAAAKPLWQGPANLMARWNRLQRIELDTTIAKDFKVMKKIEETTGQYGSVVHQRFKPASLLQDPPRPEDVTLELLMSSQTHMGHHTARWNPANSRYIYGVRDNIHIISLEETAAALRRAAKVVEEVAYLGGLILFVGNRKGQMEITARAAELAGACHLFTKWVPGTITNRDQILGKESLKIVDEKDEPVKGYERLLLEKRPLMPELVVVLNPMENFVLLHECAQENIPTIGLIDTNADPTRVTYCIPGNDDSLRSVSVIAGVLGRAGEMGQERRKRDAAKGVCTWRNPPDIEKWINENAGKNAHLAPVEEEDYGELTQEEFAEQEREDDGAWQSDMAEAAREMAREAAAMARETGARPSEVEKIDFDDASLQDPSVLPEKQPGRRPIGISSGDWVFAVDKVGFPEEVGADEVAAENKVDVDEKANAKKD